MITRYQFIARTTDGLVISYNPSPASVGDPSPWNLSTGEILYNLTFDTVAGADIVTPRGSPSVGDIYDGTTYTESSLGDYLDLTWEGSGIQASDMREMVADGINSETVKLTKRENETNIAKTATTDNDEYRVCLRNSVGKPSAGKVQLANGVATFTITPSATEKGICEVELIPIPPAVSPVKKLLISFI